MKTAQGTRKASLASSGENDTIKAARKGARSGGGAGPSEWERHLLARVASLEEARSQETRIMAAMHEEMILMQGNIARHCGMGGGDCETRLQQVDGEICKVAEKVNEIGGVLNNATRALSTKADVKRVEGLEKGLSKMDELCALFSSKIQHLESRVCHCQCQKNNGTDPSSDAAWQKKMAGERKIGGEAQREAGCESVPNSERQSAFDALSARLDAQQHQLSGVMARLAEMEDKQMGKPAMEVESREAHTATKACVATAVGKSEMGCVEDVASVTTSNKGPESNMEGRDGCGEANKKMGNGGVRAELDALKGTVAKQGEELRSISKKLEGLQKAQKADHKGIMASISAIQERQAEMEESIEQSLEELKELTDDLEDSKATQGDLEALEEVVKTQAVEMDRLLCNGLIYRDDLALRVRSLEKSLEDRPEECDEGVAGQGERPLARALTDIFPPSQEISLGSQGVDRDIDLDAIDPVSPD